MKGITEFINESIEARLAPHKKEFSKAECDFIDGIIGEDWYFVTCHEPDYKKIANLIKDMQPIATLSDGLDYKAYIDEDRGIKVVYAVDSKCYLVEAFLMDKATKDRY